MSLKRVTGDRLFLFLGHIALDFVNTVEWHASDHPEDSLKTYSDLIDWSVQAGSLSKEQGAYLNEAQTVRLNEAETALTLARALREAIYRLVLTAITRAKPIAADLETLNHVLREGLFRLRVEASVGKYGLLWARDDMLTSPLWPVAWAAAQLLTAPELRRVKQCASEDGCGWVFLDRSKNLSRRWCQMRACGNTAKARRYRKRLNPT